jgi:hypothetical protein
MGGVAFGSGGGGSAGAGGGACSGSGCGEVAFSSAGSGSAEFSSSAAPAASRLTTITRSSLVSGRFPGPKDSSMTNRTAVISSARLMASVRRPAPMLSCSK